LDAISAHIKNNRHINFSLQKYIYGFFFPFSVKFQFLYCRINSWGINIPDILFISRDLIMYGKFSGISLMVIVVDSWLLGNEIWVSCHFAARDAHTHALTHVTCDPRNRDRCTHHTPGSHGSAAETRRDVPVTDAFHDTNSHPRSARKSFVLSFPLGTSLSALFVELAIFIFIFILYYL
jgi:hypothetical protein